MEGEIGIEQTPYMKDLDQRDIMAKAEMGFLKVIVQPLWIIMNNFLKNQASEQVENISNNLKEWENIYNECMEGKLKSDKSVFIPKSPRRDDSQNASEGASIEKSPIIPTPKKVLSAFKAMIKKN